MGKVIADMTVSLDGFIAGPNDSIDNPLGDDGERLRECMTALGGGIRLLDGLDADTFRLEPDRVLESPAVTHIRYRVAQA